MSTYKLNKIIDGLGDIEEVDIEQEREIIVQDFCELVAAGKSPAMTFYCFIDDKRVFSFSLSGSSETYSQELWYVAMLFTSLYHAKIIAVYDTVLPYMGSQESPAIVTINFSFHDDLDVVQFPFRVVDGEIQDLSEHMVANPAVNYASDEIIVLFKTISLSHFKDFTILIEDMIEFMESEGISFTFYGNYSKETLESDLNKYRDIKVEIPSDDREEG